MSTLGRVKKIASSHFSIDLFRKIVILAELRLCFLFLPCISFSKIILNASKVIEARLKVFYDFVLFYFVYKIGDINVSIFCIIKCF